MKRQLLILSLLPSLCNFNYLQISVNIKWLNSKKRKQTNKQTSLEENWNLIWENIITSKKILIDLSRSSFCYVAQFYTSKISKISNTYHLSNWSLFVNKNAGLQSWNFIKSRIRHRRFLENIVKFKNIYFEEHLWTAVWRFCYKSK